MSDVLRVLAVFALVAANAFLVAAEFAVVAARRARLAARADRGSRGAQAALRLMDDPIRVISSTQVGITAIGILTGAVGEPLVLDLLGHDLPNGLAFLVALSFVTYLSAVFGELVPKALALDRAETILVAVAVPIEVMTKALRPVVAVLETSAAVVLRPFGVRDIVAGETVRNAEELRAIVDEAEGAGVIPRAQEEMLHNVFDFADREAADVMVPAPDVAWLEGGLTPEQALDAIADRPYSRYPVAEGSLDSLVGVIHARELLAATRAAPTAPIRGSARPTLLVPRPRISAPCCASCATPGNTWRSRSTSTAVPRASSRSMTIDDVNEALGTDLDTSYARTLAGLVLNELGRRPREGDEVQVGDVRLQVEQLDGYRITRLLVRIDGKITQNA